MKIGTISESLEDYLLIISQLLIDKQFARVKDIAETKQVKMSSVSSALKRLSREGLIEYTARDNVAMTSRGETLARRLLNRRDQVTHFLHTVLGVPIEQAKLDAGGMEHHVSLETLDRLAALHSFLENSLFAELDIPSRFSQYYNHCLLGIPDEHEIGTNICRERMQKSLETERTLLDLKPGEKATIKRLIAKSAIRQRLVDMGFLPNVEILMERVAPLGDPIEVKIKGFHLSLRKEEAKHILIQGEASIDHDDITNSTHVSNTTVN